MVHHFNNFLASVMSFALFFLLLHPALERCSCLLCTCRLLGAARKNHSLAGWCHCIFMVSNLSWALTAAPHSVCSWSLLPLILRLAILELLHTLPQIPTLSLSSHSHLVHSLPKKENRSHWTGSPLLPSTFSANLSPSHLSLPPVLLSYWNSDPSCSQSNLTTCAQLFLRDVFPSPIPSLGSSAFFFIGFAPSA